MADVLIAELAAAQVCQDEAQPLPRDAHARGEPRVREDRKLRGRPPAGGRLHARLTDEPGRGQLRQVLIDRRQAEAQGRGDLLLGAGDARLVQIPVDAAARLPAAGADGLVEGRDLRHAGHLQNSCDFTSILSELLQKSRREFFKRKR